MRTKSPYVLFFRILITLFFTLSLTRIGFCQENIIRIDIEGNRRIETSLIRINISAKVGDPLSQETVSNDIKKIYKLGFFDDVSAEVEKTPQGGILIYNVKEKPVVVDLRGKGMKKIKKDGILKVIEVKEGRIIEL